MHTGINRRKFITATAAGVGLLALDATKLAAKIPDKPTMPLRPLGKTGWMISIVGFGGGSRYLTQKNLDVAERMIHRAVELGVNYFDTGYSYRTGEVRESHIRYGRFLTPNYRNEIFLSTKLQARDAETVKRRVSAKQLIRYALTLPVAAAVIGMPNLEIIESNATIAWTLKPIPDRERRNINQKLSTAAVDGTLPYLATGYCDGIWA